MKPSTYSTPTSSSFELPLSWRNCFKSLLVITCGNSQLLCFTCFGPLFSSPWDAREQYTTWHPRCPAYPTLLLPAISGFLSPLFPAEARSPSNERIMEAGKTPHVVAGARPA